MKSLSKYTKIVVFDLETTGFLAKKDKIVEFGALVFENGDLVNEHNFLVDPGVPITNSHIHNITNEMCEKDGISYTALIVFLNEMFQFNDETLFMAYNIQFDISFILELLTNNQDNSKLNMLDVMAIYKDRYPFDGEEDKNGKKYGHRLDSMVKNLKIEIKNDHRAVTDATATMLGLVALSKDSDNLSLYVNKIGYNPKYGCKEPKFAHIDYIPQQLYGNREIEMFTKEVKEDTGPKEYVLETTDEKGDKRYFCSDDRFEGLNKHITFSRRICKFLTNEEAVYLSKMVKKEYNASKNKAKMFRADHLFIMKVKIER